MWKKGGKNGSTFHSLDCITDLVFSLSNIVAL